MLGASPSGGGRRVTVVMYHYVRDLARSRYPEIKGLTVDRFRGQLDHILARYTPVGVEQLLAAARGDYALPANAILLTFDDGYLDHYTVVFPLLAERRVPGLFFVPAKVVLDHRVLEVNKIHFVLATVGERAPLVERVLAAVRSAPAELGLEAPEAYLARYAVPSRFDPEEVMFIKRMLQTGLPDAVRRPLLDELFRTHVSTDEAAFAGELYAGLDQLRLMSRAGMYIGAHGYEHRWLNRMSAAEQAHEIDASLRFLATVGTPTEEWVMCYPYGGWDEGLLALLRARSCAVGLTTRVDVADLATQDPLLLPRLDANDIPSV